MARVNRKALAPPSHNPNSHIGFSAEAAKVVAEENGQINGSPNLCSNLCDLCVEQPVQHAMLSGLAPALGKSLLQVGDEVTSRLIISDMAEGQRLLTSSPTSNM